MIQRVKSILKLSEMGVIERVILTVAIIGTVTVMLITSY